MNKNRNQSLTLDQYPNEKVQKMKVELQKDLSEVSHAKQSVPVKSTNAIDLSLLKYKFTLQNQSEKYKNLFLDRGKKKADILSQSFSVNIETKQIKKKKSSNSSRNELLQMIKDSSLEKLSYLQKKKVRSPYNRLSQTIDPNELINRTSVSNLNQNEQSSLTQIDTQSDPKIDKAKMNLSKRSQYRQSVQPYNKNDTKFQNYGGLQISNHSSYNTSLGFGFENQLKKNYLKSIVDRYFPNEDSQKKQRANLPQKQSINLLRNSKRVSNPSVILPSIKSTSDVDQKSKNKNQFQNSESSDQFKHCSKEQKQSKENGSEGSHELQNLLMMKNSSVVSVSQSYVLDKIFEEEEFQDQQLQIQDFYGNSSHKFSSIMLNSQQSSSSLVLSSSRQDLLDLVSQKQSKKLYPRTNQKILKIFENHSFSIYKVKSTIFQNLSQSNDLQTVSYQYQFRKYFKNQGSKELKNRQMKAKKIIEMTKNHQKAICLWQEDLFDPYCIKLSQSKVSSGQTFSLTLSKLLYKITPSQQSGSSQFALIKPSFHANSYSSCFNQYNLLSSFNYGLLKMILNISIQLQPLSHRIINNKISLNNIFFLQQDRYAINQWSYSYFKQQNLIQNKKFQKRLEPILKNQFNDWFITPQYLAPQILENLCHSSTQVVKYWKKIEGKKMQKTIVHQNDLFTYGNKSDIWSLGLMILEIITLIPMWIGEKCIVENKTSPKISPRKGFLHCQNRDLLKILTKQSYLKENLNKILRIEVQPYQLDEWLINLIHRMLDLNPATRISFEEIVVVLRQEEKVIKEKMKKISK